MVNTHGFTNDEMHPLGCHERAGWGFFAQPPSCHAGHEGRYAKNPTLVLSMHALDVVVTRDHSATAAKCAAFLRRQAMVMSVSITSPNTA
jgi:hypothetical protein